MYATQADNIREITPMLRGFGPSDNMARHEQGSIHNIADSTARAVILKRERSDSILSLSPTSLSLLVVGWDNPDS
jgi:hypothetical protein